VGDVSGWIVKWGGKLDELTQGQNAILPQVTSDQFVSGVIEELKIAEAEPDLASRQRLHGLLVSYVKGVRDFGETKDALTRGQKIGGMELPEDIANELLSYVDEKKKFLRVADVDANGRPSARPAVRESSPRILRDIKRPPVPVPKSADDIDVSVGADGRSSDANIRTSVGADGRPPLRTPMTSAPSTEKEEDKAQQITEAIVQYLHLPPHEQMQKRLMALVDARVRGIRDARQTCERLALPLTQGGMGWSGDRLKTACDILEKTVGKGQQEHQEKMIKEKQQRAQTVAQKQAQKSEVDHKESQLLSQRYATITGKVPQEGVDPVHAAGTRTTAARSVAEHLDRQEAMVDKEKVKQAIEATKPQSVVAAVTHSAQTILTSGRPQVQDVRTVKHLEGTVEELKRMTLTDFRRLAPTPMIAVQRILDKLELLREQGPDRLVSGVEAWKHSPLHAAYMALAKEAVLSAKSLRTLLSERRATSQDELTDEELSAVIALNDQVRY
jgi:hypothetical protein